MDANVEESWRLVNKKDIVPHVPPKLFGYHHPGTEVWLYDGQNYVLCDSSGEDGSCSNSAGPLFSALDHAKMLGYNAVNGINGGCFADKNDPAEFALRLNEAIRYEIN